MLFFVALAVAAETPDYGVDLSLSYGMGALLNRWPEPSPHGIGGFRLDLFPQSREVGGTRVGASIWARSSAWPGPTAAETVGNVEQLFPFDWQQYGMHVVFRSDPAERWGGTFGFGFSRIDIEDYHDGVLALPMFSVEGGLRRNLFPVFLDLYAVGGWATAGNEVGGWEEWWSLSGALAVGFYVR